MTPLADLTLMFWSAARIYRSDRPQLFVKSTLLHVSLNATGKVQAKAEQLLKEIIDGPSHDDPGRTDGGNAA